VLVGAPVTLNGSVSSDPDGHLPLAYRWRQSGGSAVALSAADGVSPAFTAPGLPTVLTFALVVTDARGVAGATADTVVVTVTDSAVTAVTAANSGPVTLGQPVALTATVTGGSNVTLAWNFGDGQSGGGATVTHTYGAPGIYTAWVTATNGAGSLAASTTVTVTNLPPIANAGADQQVLAGAPVTLNGSVSSDPDGHLPLAYRWRQSGGSAVALSAADGVSPAFTAPGLPGALTFSLVVTDARGVAGATADTVAVTVVDQAISGLAALAGSPAAVDEPLAFTATAAAGTNVLFAWDFGDGATGAGANISHRYAAAGVYTAVVTASNSAGAAVVALPVTVTAPLARIRLAQTVGVDPAVCSDATEVTVTPGATIYYCYRVENTGAGTFLAHTLENSFRGVIFSQRSFALAPGEAADTVTTLPLQTVVSQTVAISTTTVATWTAAVDAPLVVAAETPGQAVNGVTAIINVANVSLLLDVSAGEEAGVCGEQTVLVVAAGTPIYFCITLRNTGEYTLTGITLQLQGVELPLTGVVLAPGAILQLTSADTPLLGPIAVNEGLSFVAGVRSGAGGGVLGQIAAQSPALQILLAPTGLEEGEESTGSRIYLPAVTR
jgi:PKD repeat protein